MTLSAVALAARNNAEWCDAVARSHGGEAAFADGYWINRGEAPPTYPNLVTLTPEPERAMAAISGAIDAAPDRAFSVKDSFQRLDLAPLGFAPLLEATWIRRAAIPLTGGRTQFVRDAETLARWEEAWGERDAALFRPALLAEPEHAFIAATAEGRILAGCVASRSSAVVGVSNLFGPAALQADCIAAAMDFGPGRTVVGYEPGAALARMKRWGFQALGRLRVWVRPAA